MKRYIAPFLAGILLFSGCSAQKSADICIPENERALAEVVSEDSMNLSGADMHAAGYAREIAEPETVSVQAPDESAGAFQTESTEFREPAYVILRQQPVLFYSEDGTEILTGKFPDISVHSGSGRTDRWLDDMLAEIAEEQKAMQTDLLSQAQTAYEDCRTGSGDCKFYPYSFYADIGMKRLDNQVLSMTVLSSANSGEDEPAVSCTAYNFDLKNQKLLTLKDIIRPVGQQNLKDQILNSSASRMDILKDNGLNPADAVTDFCADGRLDSCWYFSSGGLVFTFDPLVEIEIPYDDLNGILRKEFFPDERIPCDGNFSAGALPQSDHPIELDLSGSDDCWQMYADVQNCVYDVSVRNIHHWIDSGIPVLSNEVFFAGSLSSADEIRITADAGRDLHVAFRDGSGRKISGVIGRDGFRNLSGPES